MKLDVFHVDQLRARMVRERVAGAGAIQAVARDLIGFTHVASREHDRFRAEEVTSPALAIVTKRGADPLAVLEQSKDADFHVHIDPAMHAVVLQGPDHLETGAITDMS